VPDIHGRTFWKDAVEQNIDAVDRIVFLGDYLDPYRDEGYVYTYEGIIDNLMEIIALKRANADKVVLLKGNHDEHYSSRPFRASACGSRIDRDHLLEIYDVFVKNADVFRLAHLEDVGGTSYLFTHAGVTSYWLGQVNSRLWQLDENSISVADPAMIERINRLDHDFEGEQLLAIVGIYRSHFGKPTGSILWADVNEHPLTAPSTYGLNQVFQVFGHTRLKNGSAMVAAPHFAMIDSLQCFMIDENSSEPIRPLLL